MVYPKELKNKALRQMYAQIFIRILFRIAKLWKELKYLSTGKWINNVDTKYTIYNRTLLKQKGMKYSQIPQHI
jgi:hypothetical protein